MADWFITRQGDAINLDLCTQVIVVSLGESFSVRAFFPGDYNKEPYYDLEEFDTQEEAKQYLHQIFYFRSVGNAT